MTTAEDCNKDPQWLLMREIKKIVDWWVAPLGAGEHLARTAHSLAMIQDILTPESSKTIALWAEQTFGQATALSTAIRAQKELNELIEVLALEAEGRIQEDPGTYDPKVMNEVADVRIVLARIQRFFPNGGTAEEAEQRKMVINRARKWKLDGYGHGQHVKEES